MKNNKEIEIEKLSLIFSFTEKQKKESWLKNISYIKSELHQTNNLKCKRYYKSVCQILQKK